MSAARIHRRGLFGLIGAAGVAGAARAGQPGEQGAGLFRHGVASGDPLADRLIVWTRITTPRAAEAVRWEVAADADFRRILARGRATAESARDHTVKVDVAGLPAGAEVFYRFHAAGETSPVGRGRTLPAGPTPEVVLAVVSCQLYPGGLFNAYDAIARLERLDAVVHLGDYIYEYGAEDDAYGMATGKTLGRQPDPPHEIVALADYRRRHAQYKSDPDLQAAHARAPFICVWDDHETANDSWVGGAQNHQPEAEGEWSRRKAVALRAYYEWMPLREPKLVTETAALARRFDFGDLASLHMVETRLTARDEGLTYADMGSTPQSVAAFRNRLADPTRELMGEPQRQGLQDAMTRSREAGRPWQVVGNQVVMAQVLTPDVAASLPPQSVKAMLDSLNPLVRGEVERAMVAAKMNLPYNLDAWDGYPAARARLYAGFVASGARPIVLAGDSHAFWVNQLKAANGDTVAVELGTSAISSPSNGDALPGLDLGAAMMRRNDEVIFSDQRAKGYVLLTLRPDVAEAELRAVSTILAKPYEETTLKRFRIPANPAEGHLIES